MTKEQRLEAYQAAYKAAHNIPLTASEVIGQRTRVSKTFLLPDGQFRTIVHGKSLHYEEVEGSGEWLDITLNVEPSGRAGYDWQVADNRFQYYFKIDHSQPYPVLASFKGHDLYQKIVAICHYDPTTDKITILQQALSSTLIVDGHHLRYNGIFTGVDLEYVVDTDFCRGFLHISEQGKTTLRNAIQQKGLNPDGWIFFATKLDLDNYDLTPEAIIGDEYARPIHWRDAASKVIHWFVPDVAQDERPGPEGSQPCRLKLYKHPSLGWVLFTALPLSWLKDSVGLVTIDPPTDYYGETADGRIYGAAATYPTARSTSSICGTALTTTESVGQYLYTSTYYCFRSYLSFDTSAIPDDATVVSSVLYVCADIDHSDIDFNVQVYRYAWAEALCTYREANYDGAYGGSATLEGTLRNTVSGWVSGTYYNLAVATAGINKTGDTKYTLVSSRDVAGTTPTGSEYVWIRFADYANTASDPYLAITYTVNQAPTAPTSLLCEGATNPTNVTDTTPEFSAIYNDPDAGDIANKYRIQVDDDAAFGSPIWDSGAAGTAMGNVTAGQRCADISYAGSALTGGIKYYWRIKFWDDDGAEGAYSDGTDYFYLQKDATQTDALSLSETPAVQATLTTSDAVSLAIAIVITVAVGITDGLNLAEVPSIEAAVPITDTIALAESPIVQIDALLTEDLAFVETIAVEAEVGVADDLALVEVAESEMAVPISDTLILSEIPTVQADIPITDILILDETIAGQREWAIADNLMVAEVPTIQADAADSDALSLAESPLVQADLSLADGLNLTEDMAIEAAVGVTDTLALAETPVAEAHLAVPDSLSLAETAEVGQLKDTTDILALTEAVAVQADVPMADDLALTEALDIARTAYLTDAVVLSEAVAIAAHISVTDVLVLAETVGGDRERAITDSLALAEVVIVAGKPLPALTWLNVYDTSGILKARIFECPINECSSRSNTFGLLRFPIHQDAQGRDQLVKGRWVEVYRQTSSGGATIWSGIICYVKKLFDENGDPTRYYEITARSFEWLPYWRRMVPAAGQDYFYKSGSKVDDAAKYLVRYCMVSGYASAARAISGFTVEADDTEHADTKTLAGRYEDRLGDKLEAWAKAYDFDWWVEANCPAATFVLRTKVPRRGTDKSASVVFTVGRHNLLALEYYEDDLDTAQLCYVGGPGEGATQVIRTVYDGAEPTGWNRREMYVPLSNAEYTDELDVGGHAWLDSFGDTLVGVRFELNETEASKWRTNFDIGDLVTVYDSDFGVDKVAEIKEVNYVLDEDGVEHIELTVGEPQPSKWDLLQAGLGAYSSFDDDAAPAVPTGFAVSTGTATDEDGHQHSYLSASWNANAELDIGGYEVTWTVGGNVSSAKTSAVSLFIFPVDANAAYSVQVKAVDKAGNESAYCTAATGTTAKDTAAPANPTGLTSFSRFKSVYLAWTNPTDSDLDYIQVWRNSSASWTGATKIADVDGTSHTDEIGLWNSSFYYALKAVDRTGNISTGTAWVLGQTDIVAPAAPTGLSTSTGTIVDVDGHIIPYVEATWTDSITEDVQAHELEIQFQIAAVWKDPTTYRCEGSPLRVSPVPGNVSYRVRVRALDDAQLPSDWTAYSTGTTGKDNVAPSQPSSLSYVGLQQAIELSWTNPTEADFSHVEVYRNTVDNSATSTKIAENDGTSYTDAGLTVSASFYYWLKSVDSSGNKSAYTAFGLCSTDTTPPAVPTGLAVIPALALDADGHQGSYLDCSWNASTADDFDQYELKWVVDTETSTTVTRETSYRVGPVIANKSYSVQVKAIDRAGNASAYCTAVTGTTLKDTQAPGNPTGLTSYSRFKAVNLKWTNPTDTDLSYIQVWRNSSPSWTGSARRADVDGSEYTDEIGLWDSTFYYALRAVDESGNISAGTAWVLGQTDIVPPAAPSGLSTTTGTVVDADGHIIPWVRATWTNSITEDVQSHELELQYSTDGGVTWWDPVTYRAAGPPLRITPVPGNVKYRARVRALDDANLESEWTAYYPAAPGYGTTAKDNVGPADPAGLTVTAGKKSVVISFTTPTDGDWAHTEFYCSTVNPPVTLVNKGRVSSFTYETANYSLHYARVRHVDTSGNASGYSSVLSATPEQVSTPDVIPGGLDGDTVLGDLTVGTAKIGNLAVTTAKIDNLAVTDAKIDSLSAAKITAGTVVATISIQSAGTIGFVNGATFSGSEGYIVCSGKITATEFSAEGIASAGTIVRAGTAFYLASTEVITSGLVLQNVTIAAGVTGGGGLSPAWANVTGKPAETGPAGASAGGTSYIYSITVGGTDHIAGYAGSAHDHAIP